MKSVTHVAGQLCYPCSRLHPLVCAQRAPEASGLEILRRQAPRRASFILTHHTHDQPHVPDSAFAAHCNLVKQKRHMSTDRKSTRLNSSHLRISYAVFCLKKKKNIYSSNGQTFAYTLYTNVTQYCVVHDVDTNILETS